MKRRPIIFGLIGTLYVGIGAAHWPSGNTGFFTTLELVIGTTYLVAAAISARWPNPRT